MAATKEELQERAQLVRLHEANCTIEHPNDEERQFRIAIMRKLGMEYGLREMRSVSIGTPTTPATNKARS